jgi:hypothetical protein
MQKKVIDLQGDHICRQYFFATTLAEGRLGTGMIAQISDIGTFQGILNWLPASTLLMEIFENEGIKVLAEDCVDKIQRLSGLQIVQAPRRLAKSKNVHTMDFPDLEPLRKHIQIVSLLLYLCLQSLI